MVRCSRTLVIMLGAWLAQSGMAAAQFQFESDYLYMKQAGRSSSSFISGPNGISTGDLDFGYQSGYRFGVSGGSDWWEIEAVFSQIDNWSDRLDRGLTSALVFDDPSNGFIPGGPPGNSLGFVNSLFDAATSSTVGADETTEIELLQPGAVAILRASSRYRDFELNFASNRHRTWYRYGIGWRNIQFDENAAMLATGTFDAIDSDDGAVFGGVGNDPNDGLSNAALIEAGYTSVSGGANGFDAAAVPGLGPDTLRLYYGGRARNELNGIQALLAVKLIPSDLVYIEGIAKAGVYHNNVNASATEMLIGSGNDDSVYQRNFSDHKGTGAFVGTLGLRGLIPVTDYINVVTGYEVLFLSGIALGTEQFQGVHDDLLGNRSFSAKANDSLVLHGGKLGIEVSW